MCPTPLSWLLGPDWYQSVPWFPPGRWAGVGSLRPWPCPSPQRLPLLPGPSQALASPDRLFTRLLSPPPLPPALSSLLVAYLKDRRLSGGAGSPTAPLLLMHGHPRPAPHPGTLCSFLRAALQPGRILPWRRPVSCSSVGSVPLRALDCLGFKSVLLPGCRGPRGCQSPLEPEPLRGRAWALRGVTPGVRAGPCLSWMSGWLRSGR